MSAGGLVGLASLAELDTTVVGSRVGVGSVGGMASGSVGTTSGSGGTAVGVSGKSMGSDDTAVGSVTAGSGLAGSVPPQATKIRSRRLKKGRDKGRKEDMVTSVRWANKICG